MKRLNCLPKELRESLNNRTLLKIISGLSNFDQVSVGRTAKAAFCGGADLLDIACDADLVTKVKGFSNLPICVSAVDPELFPSAVSAGAQLIEIGNFDSFYPKGKIFSASEVLELTIKTRKILPDTPLSVTVPHVLPLDEQCKLAVDLVEVGADLIQTEGGTSARPISLGSLGLIEKASPTLAATYEISQMFQEVGLNIPVLSASGLSSVTVPMAIAAGASGVGVGSAVNKLNDEVAMIAVVRRIRESLLSSSHVYSSQTNAPQNATYLT